MGALPFRRVAVRATLEAGGPFAQLLKLDQCHPPAFKLYLDLVREGAQAVASILIESSDEEK